MVHTVLASSNPISRQHKTARHGTAQHSAVSVKIPRKRQRKKKRKEREGNGSFNSNFYVFRETNQIALNCYSASEPRGGVVTKLLELQRRTATDRKRKPLES